MDPQIVENSYRNVHLDFISNKNGSNPSDIVFASLPVSLMVPILSLILPFIYPLRYSFMKYSSRIVFHLSVEVIIIIIPVVLCTTILAGNTFMNSLSLFIVIVTLFFVTPNFWKPSARTVDWNQLWHYPISDQRPSFITNYRSGMSLATAISILAVDFQIYPRRFVKTETFGYSLMDVGVGAFIFAHGLLGSRICHSKGQWSKIYPIIGLGFLRLLSVKSLDYHEHVSEYGVHWNFFFTLALIKGIAALLKLSIRPSVISTLILVLYEIILKLGLQNWILSDYPRNDFISSNREGIFSLFGYTSLYYTSMEIGDYMKKPRALFQDWVGLLIQLLVLSIVGWNSLPYCEAIFGQPSRRLANTTFCIWMLTYNTILLSCCLTLDLLLVIVDYRRKRILNGETSNMKPILHEPYSMQFINRNGMFYFLLANLLTGLVNLSFDTVNMNSYSAMTILIGYVCLLSSSTAYLSASIYGY